MKNATRLLPMNEVLVGMIISNDVLDTHGELILGQGTVITEAMLLSLPRYGIKTLTIAAEKISDTGRQAEIELQRLRLNKLFRRCGDGPADKLLLQYLMQYRLGGMHE
ncbi:MAG: hypothetical protein ABIO19_12975 [Burkholderiaceae bacterium]